MKELILFYLSIIIIVVPYVVFGGYGKCILSNGRNGVCISTNACRGSGGRSDPGNYCPGDSSIQCCTYPDCVNSRGINGSCQPVWSCSGSSDAANRCPGGNDIQCCTGGGGSNLPYLDQRQSIYARIIAKVAHNYGMPIRGCQVALVTALVESNVLVYANWNVPESLNYDYDAVGSDYDSVGIFQQRPIYWGTVYDCMDPVGSAGKFYAALQRVSGWENVSIGTAAQEVQRSAYPDRYDAQAYKAIPICAAAY